MASADIVILRADNSYQYQQRLELAPRATVPYSQKVILKIHHILQVCQVIKLFLLIDNLAASKIGSQQNGQIGNKFFG